MLTLSFTKNNLNINYLTLSTGFREIILDCLGKSNVITQGFPNRRGKKRRGKQKRDEIGQVRF